LIKTIAKAESLADKMPRLVLAARKHASLLTMGLHGRKKAGMGDEFWQFRRFDPSEDMRKIDWRQSARTTHYAVRERELEVAHRFTLAPDLSQSMRFGSPEKAETAIIMTLVLADVLNEGGEKVALAGVTKAFSSRKMIEDMAQHIVQHEEALKHLPPVTKGDVIILTDSFGDLDQLNTLQKAQKTHIIVINDMSEESFPYAGRVIFEEQEEVLTLEAGRAENLREDYLNALKTHRETLQESVKRTNGTLNFHVTNAPLAPFLLKFTASL
jgi:uncharacterized protein (DUF58 family)